jgi:hypothetical protein
MKLYQRTNTIHGTPPSQLDCDASLPFMARLEDCTQLPDMKVMGTLLNPLYQSHWVPAKNCLNRFRMDLGQNKPSLNLV